MNIFFVYFFIINLYKIKQIYLSLVGMYLMILPLGYPYISPGGRKGGMLRITKWRKNYISFEEEFFNGVDINVAKDIPESADTLVLIDGK